DGATARPSRFARQHRARAQNDSDPGFAREGGLGFHADSSGKAALARPGWSKRAADEHQLRRWRRAGGLTPAARGGGGGGGPEGGVVRNGSSGCTMTVGGANMDFDKYQEAQRLINRAINGPNPNAAGNVFFFGGAGNRGTTGFQASTGDYLVSITVAGKTYK